MQYRRNFIFAGILLSLFLSLSHTYAQTSPSDSPTISFDRGFIENQGQFKRMGDSDPNFILSMFSEGPLSVWLTQEGLSYVFSKELAASHDSLPKQEHLCRTDIRFLDASLSKSQIVYEEPLPYTFNYIGQTDKPGIYDVKIYKQLRIKNIYQGIDYILRFDKNGTLKQEFSVGEGVDYKQIRFTVENAKKIQIRKKNNLRIVQSLGEINENGAISYALDQKGISYPTSYVKQKGIYSFSLKGRKTEAVLIDPLLEWATYFSEAMGKNSQIMDICTDERRGGLYACGWSEGAAFPYKKKEGADQWEFTSIRCPNTNALIVYFDSLKQIQWCTFYGQDIWDEQIIGMGISPKGHLICVGNVSFDISRTMAHSLNLADFPPLFSLEKEGAYKSEGDARTFILEFDTNHRLQWAGLHGIRAHRNTNNVRDTFTRNVSPLKMLVSKKDEIYIIGSWHGAKGELVVPFQKETEESFSNSSADVLILKFDKNRALVWTTAYGATGTHLYEPIQPWCSPSRIALDSANNLWIGGTFVHNFPYQTKVGAYNQIWNFPDTSQISGVSKGYFDFRYVGKENTLDYRDKHGTKDLFLSKFTSTGVLIWSTAIGGHWEEELKDMKAAPNGHIFLTGFTRSKDFPIQKKQGAFNHYYASGRNAFLMEFSAQGALLWSTHLPKRDSLFTTSANASVLCITPENGIYIMGTGPITDDTLVDLRSHFSWGLDEMAKELGLYEWYGSNKLITNHLRSITDSAHSPTFLMYFNPQGELLLWDSLPLYGNEVNSGHTPFYFSVIDSSYFYSSSIHRKSPFQSLSLDSRGKIWGLLSRWGNTALVNPKDGSHFAANTKAYPKTSDLLFRYNNCLPQFLPDRLGYGDTLYCPSQPIVLQKPPRFHEYRCKWSNGSSADSLRLTLPGTYWLSLHSIYPHCPVLYSDTLKVDSIPIPLLHFPSDTTYFCVGEKLKLDAFHLGASYLWYNGSTDSAIIIEYQGDSLIHAWCRVSNPCGDTVFDTAMVLYAPPYVYLGADTVLCHRETLFLDAAKYNGDLPCLYTWYINGDSLANTPTYTLSRFADTFLLCVKVTLPTPNSCIAWDTLNVHYYPYADVSLHLPDTTFCSGSSLILDARQNTSNLDAQYKWYSPEGELFSESPIVTLSDTGFFIVHAKNYCSQTTDTLHIGYVPRAWTQIDLPSDTLVCQPHTYSLDVAVPNPGTTYQWEDGSTNPQRTFSASGSYTITLTDSMNCSQSHTLALRIEACPIELSLPNVFTPNNDGINDLFAPRDAGQLIDFEIYIYNAWGLAVYRYKGDPLAMSWNGRVHNTGALAPDGAYFWIVTCKDLLGKSKKQTGCVMILR